MEESEEINFLLSQQYKELDKENEVTKSKLNQASEVFSNERQRFRGVLMEYERESVERTQHLDDEINKIRKTLREKRK